MLCFMLQSEEIKQAAHDAANTINEISKGSEKVCPRVTVWHHVYMGGFSCLCLKPKKLFENGVNYTRCPQGFQALP